MTRELILKLVLKHWKEILLLVLLTIVVGKFRYDYRQLEKAYEVTEQSLEEQIAGLKEIHQRELERRDVALQDYREALDTLEENYMESQIALEREKRDSKKAHIRDFSTDSNQLIKDIEEAYGFINVP
jgi:hypothetical protein